MNQTINYSLENDTYRCKTAYSVPKMIRYSLSADGTTLATMIAGANGARPQTVSLKKVP